MIIISNKYIDT